MGNREFRDGKSGSRGKGSFLLWERGDHPLHGAVGLGSGVTLNPDPVFSGRGSNTHAWRSHLRSHFDKSIGPSSIETPFEHVATRGRKFFACGSRMGYRVLI